MVLVMIEYAYWALINFFAAVDPPPPLVHTMRANVLPVGCIGQGLCSAVGAPGYNLRGSNKGRKVEKLCCATKLQNCGHLDHFRERPAWNLISSIFVFGKLEKNALQFEHADVKFDHLLG